MKKLHYILLTFLLLCFSSLNVFASEQVDFPNEDLLGLYSVRNDEYKYTATHYGRLDSERHLFFSVSSANTCYIIRESAGTIDYGSVVENDGSSTPTSIYLNAYNFELRKNWNLLFDAYIYGFNYYPGDLLVAAHDFESESALINYLKDFSSFDDLYNNTSSDFGGGNVPSNRLPMLKFKINQAFTLGDSLTDTASVKYTFSWSVSEHELYANNPNKYILQMVASGDISATSSMGVDSLVTNKIGYINDSCKTHISQAIPIYKESFSFLERTYREILCKTAEVNPLDWGPQNFWYLYVRIVESETEKCSLWKVYKCQGRFITPTGYAYDDSGEIVPIEEDDEVDDSAEYDDDPRTDDYDDPTSPAYNDGTELDAKFLLNNLEEIVSMLKSIPDLFSKVFSWMPTSLILLITTSIGLMIVVGFVKMFLR